MKDVCVICNKETDYDVNIPVQYRKYYIDGGGPLCKTCFNRVYGEK